MRKRTLAREIVLKILYQMNINQYPLEEILTQFWKENKTEPEVREFAERLVRGACKNSKKIDEIISKHTKNWQLSRMAVVDRNILRFATYELLCMDDIPPKVTINEAVNIAKKYSQEDSGKFVNGILDNINHTEERFKG